MNETEFSMRTVGLEPKNSLPLTLHITVCILGNVTLNVTLHQVQGILSKSSLNSRVYMKNKTHPNVKQVEMDQLVSLFE